MSPTAVYDSYWRFAAERQAMLRRRLAGAPRPWTSDPVLARYRFTNPYRCADRVSQYLVHAVQWRDDRPQTPRELFFRTLLFKVFNRIETWEAIEAALGPVVWSHADLDRLAALLDERRARGHPLYSAAYVLPPPGLGAGSKHRDHLALLRRMADDRLPERLHQAPELQDVFAGLARYPGLGPFLAFQFAIDLNYSRFCDHDENSFVVAGPGALDGIGKCFAGPGRRDPVALIRRTAARQNAEFKERGLDFPLWDGRALQLVDCQNLYCEISKYARVAHPESVGPGGRLRIKQAYRLHARPLSAPMLPPKWQSK